MKTFLIALAVAGSALSLTACDDNDDRDENRVEVNTGSELPDRGNEHAE